MPPLCTMGFGLGSGLNLDIIGGAGLLFLTNLVAIVASAFLVFLAVGMSNAEVKRVAREGEPVARILTSDSFVGVLATSGQLGLRVLTILILLGSIAVPLRRALLQVADETVTRGAVQEELSRVVSSKGIDFHPAYPRSGYKHGATGS